MQSSPCYYNWFLFSCIICLLLFLNVSLQYETIFKKSNHCVKSWCILFCCTSKIKKANTSVICGIVVCLSFIRTLRQQAEYQPYPYQQVRSYGNWMFLVWVCTLETEQVLAWISLLKLMVLGSMMKHPAISTYEGSIFTFYNVILSGGSIIGILCSKDSYLHLQPTQLTSELLIPNF